MKVCPVCKTTLFEDMEVCYGCMYHFGSDPELEKHMKDEEIKLQSDTQQGAIKRSIGEDLRREKDPESTESYTPEKPTDKQEPKEESIDNEQLWTVRFEVRRGSDENQVWSAEATLPLKAMHQTSLPLV